MATDFTTYIGDSKSLEIAITDSDGAAVDVSTAQAVVYALFARAGGAALVTKTLDDGVSVATSTVTVALAPADTAELAPGLYLHELQITDSAGAVTTALQGSVALRAGYIE